MRKRKTINVSTKSLLRHVGKEVLFMVKKKYRSVFGRTFWGYVKNGRHGIFIEGAGQAITDLDVFTGKAELNFRGRTEI